ncbi:MAG: KpsF/GutQ family sugar-phosphate isomerase [Bacteroidota bacterium]|nr:KpsF/GutQ family sugar-phosphate isomerase [Bacteroidota bacterium]
MLSPQEIIDNAKQTIRTEAAEILALEQHIDSGFADAVQCIIQSTGRVVVTGIGKSAIIGQKIVATLNSTGTPSVFMHAADAVHGDLGTLQQDDIIIAISKSGETSEIKVLTPLLKRAGNKLIAMVGNTNSYLATHADMLLNCTISTEACPNNLAPTSSTTAQLVMGDALAVALLSCRNFGPEDFAKFHPGGALGKKLYMKVGDIISSEKPIVNPDSPLKEVIYSISSGRLGATAVINGDKICGIITDGDLRRLIEKTDNLAGTTATNLMNTAPKQIEKNAMATEALELVREYKISQLLVTDSGKYVGLLHIHDLNREGII